MKLRNYIRLALILIMAATIIAVGAVLAAILRKSKPQVWTFADGTRLELLGVTRNLETFTTEKPWEKQARRWLPSKLSGWLSSPFSTTSGLVNSNSIAVWFTLTDARGSNVNSHPWAWYGTVSDDGFQFSYGGGSGSLWSGGKTYHHIDLESFPRRQKTFDLKLFDNNHQSLATLRLKNPVNGPFPDWSGEPLPVTHTNGPLAVTLERLTESSNRHDFWINAKWKTTATDPRWNKAKPEYQQWEDATGNRGGRLSFEETAWKLVMPFHRRGWTNFSDDEKFVLNGLPVPGAGTMQLLQTNFTRQGVQFVVHALAGIGSLTITNGTNYSMTSSFGGGGWSTTQDEKRRIESYSSSKPFFLIETSRPDTLDEIRFRVVSSDGRELPLDYGGWRGSTGGRRFYQQKFDATNEVSTLSLEITVSRARLFEFTINPAEVKRIGSTNK